MTIQRYALGMGSEDPYSEEVPCLFQDENGEAVTYDDHIAEVQRLRELLREVRPFVDHAHEQFVDYPDDLNDRIAAECGKDRPVVGRT
jgi:hypothetical protein